VSDIVWPSHPLHLTGAARPAPAGELGRQAETENRGDTRMTKVTPFLMFNDQLEAAIAFYTTTFPDSEIKNVARTGKDGPINSAEFVIGGQFFMGYNGGPYFKFSEGFSLFVDCKDQEEVDEYWNKLISAGATPSQCGWITDQFGITWQIVPRRFMELISDKNQKKVQAVMEAMMKMVKLDVAALERAYDDA
jgi:predicted 3-demethylubiquinone-9 3-methyltransferase (glyoxalase superfamily)